MVDISYFSIITFLAIVVFIVFICKLLTSKKGSDKVTKIYYSFDDCEFISVYFGSGLEKYYDSKSEFNFLNRLEKFFNNYKAEKGYSFKKPQVYVSNDIEPNQVLINWSNSKENGVLLNIHNDYIFSFQQSSHTDVFSENYPLYDNLVYFYKKDDLSINPVEIWKNDIVDSVSETQILDLLIVIYKDFCLRSFAHVVSEIFKSEIQQKAQSLYFEGNPESEYEVRNELFSSICSEIIDFFVSFEKPLVSLEEVFALAEEMVALHEEEDISVFDYLISKQNIRTQFFNYFLQDDKLMLYAISDDFINSIVAYIESPLYFKEGNQVKKALLNRFYSFINLNKRTIILCKREFRDDLYYLFKKHCPFFNVLPLEDIPCDLQYEIIGKIE